MTARSAAFAFALVVLAGVAHAQPRDVAKADALFREGRALMKKGDYETACPKLEESYRLDPAAGTGINLGDCFEKQGKVASALLAYQAARALLKPGDPRIGPVEKEIAALDKRAPRLTIKLAPGAPEGTTVKRDGREVEASKLGVPVAVNPGKYKVTVTAPGRDTTVFRVTLAEGTSRALEVGPGENPGLAPGPTTDAPTGASGTARVESSGGDSSLRWLVVGTGTVLVGVGVVAGIVWKTNYDQAIGLCPNKCPNEGKLTEYNDAKDTSDDAMKVTLVAGGVGVGALLTGLFLLAPAEEPRSMGLRAAPRVSGGGYGFQLEGAW
ncbi:MAG: tetratricopeptide repeat protein [Myxococcales bacterium]|nr:tetratricopeptide repeat protein [Myxococcales bacterium]